jgi:hypothetical protein
MKQIWVAGFNAGYVVITSHSERKAAKTGKAVKLSGRYQAGLRNSKKLSVQF